MHEPWLRFAYFIFTIGACGYAAARGQWPERAGVAICVAGSLLSVAAQLPALAPYRQVMRGVLTVDLAVAAAFLALGLSSGRFWPIWSLGFTLAGVFAHLGRVTISYAPAMRYFHSVGLWAYPAMLAMVLGTWIEARRKPIGRP